MPAADALKRIGLEPLQLGPKEGLALINGTQASTALALDALFMGERVFAAAIAAGALSVDALKGSAKPFDPRISELRGQPGQIRVAAAIAGLLDGSEILTSHVKCSRVQDPYSFRCQPQVMGASLDLLQNAARTLTIEAGAVTDNPIVFAGRGQRHFRRQLPRPAGRLRRRHDRHRAVRGRLDLGTPRQRPRRPEDERPAGIPDPGFGRRIRA